MTRNEKKAVIESITCSGLSDGWCVIGLGEA